MKEYVDYFINIETSINNFNALIASKRATNDAFARTYESCRMNCKYQQCSITLADLLLQPFQRISKYHLLIKDLRKNRVDTTSTSIAAASDPTLNANATTKDELRNCIEECVKRIEATGIYLNEAKRDHECMIKLEKEFASLGSPPRLDSGRLVKETTCFVGIFNEANGSSIVGGGGVSGSSGGSFKTRTVLLLETTLLIFKRNLFQRYEKVEEFSVYDIKNVKMDLG
jgi:hypothetical protein